MEQENNFNEQEVKERITDEVRAELNNLGYKLLDQDQVGGHEMCKLVTSYKNKLVDHDKEVDRIKQRYSEEVAASKLNILEADFRYDKESLVEDIDKIIAEDSQRRLAEAEKLQNTKEYKTTRKEAVQMLCMLRGANVDISDSVFMDTIAPLVEAKDTKGLEIAKLLAGNKVNEYLVDKSVDTINNYFANSDLAAFGASAKEFINTGESQLTLSLYMAKHEAMLRGGK